MIILVMVLKGDFLCLAFKRRDNKRAGKIDAERGEQEEFALVINLRELGEVFTQISFGQQIREERRHTAGTGRRVVTSPPVRPLKERLKVGRCGSSMYPCSNAKICRSPARRVMMPIWRPCSRTESALSFFRSNFIVPLLGCLIAGVVGIEGALFPLTRLVLEIVSNQGLH